MERAAAITSTWRRKARIRAPPGGLDGGGRTAASSEIGRLRERVDDGDEAMGDSFSVVIDRQQ